MYHMKNRYNFGFKTGHARRFICITYIVLASHNVDGIATMQRKISDIASVTINTFLAVRMFSRNNTADIIRQLPRTPNTMKNPYRDNKI